MKFIVYFMFFSLFLVNLYLLFYFLLQDVPVPIFMTVKGSDEWTDEEKKIAVEYERKVKELSEEREKYKKVSITIRISYYCIPSFDSNMPLRPVGGGGGGGAITAPPPPPTLM